MIARTWHGIVPINKAEGFMEYLYTTGVLEAKSTEGNLGVYVCTKSQNEYMHFFMVSYWENYNSIKEFAGEDYDLAVVYAEDNKYELISDPIVLHHEVNKIPSSFPTKLEGMPIKNTGKL